MAKQLLGKTAHVEWPYMVEALVIAVGNERVKYSLDPKTNQMQSKLLETFEAEFAQREMKTVSRNYMNKKGIECGNVQMLVSAKLLLGER